MDPKEVSITFGSIDYCTFVACLIISLAIGFYASYKRNKSPEEFFMGNRTLGPIPVALSLLATFVSPILILGHSGETYANGIQMVPFVMGICVAIGINVKISTPVLFSLKLTSVNEYIGFRFNSKPLRKTISVLVTLKLLVFLGTNLYAPTLALTTVTPLNSTTLIMIIGFVVTLYSSLGGIRAVVWTDVFQFSLILIGLFVLLVIGIIDVGGIEYIWTRALEGRRLTNFSTSFSVFERHTIFNTFLLGLVMFSSAYGVSQVHVQRICSVKSLRDVYLILAINIVGEVFIYFLVFTSGLVAYAAYADCDPWAQGLIRKKEQIVPFFLIDRLKLNIGLPGIFVAIILAGTLSTLSSILNAVVAMIWQDLCSNLKILRGIKPLTAAIINKILSFVVGIVGIGLAVIATKSRSLLQLTFSLHGSLDGGIYGVFLLGFLFPKTNLYGVWSGLLSAFIISGTISGGSLFFGKPAGHLPLSTANCSNFDVFDESTIQTASGVVNNFTARKLTPFKEDNANAFESNSFLKLFQISYTLYGAIGVASCILIAVSVSLATGNRDLKTVSPKLISPFMRRFYWSKKQIDDSLELDESNKRLNTNSNVVNDVNISNSKENCSLESD